MHELYIYIPTAPFSTTAYEHEIGFDCFFVGRVTAAVFK